jgi:hypothetical protein
LIDPAIVRRLRPTNSGTPCAFSTTSITPASQLSRRAVSAAMHEARRSDLQQGRPDAHVQEPGRRARTSTVNIAGAAIDGVDLVATYTSSS